MLSKKNASLSALLAPLESEYYISGEINSRIEGDPREKMQEIAEKYSDGTIEWLDGVSVTFYDWHFNVRPSNTEPLLRLNLEAKSREKMEEKRDEVLAIIRS
jgi:phosphomannomutase